MIKIVLSILFMIIVNGFILGEVRNDVKGRIGQLQG